MNTSDSTRQRMDMAHYKHLMTAPNIESSTREERLDYVLNEWKCLHNCEICGKCHVLKGRSEESLYADYIDGKLIHKTGSGFPSSDGRQDRNDVGIVLLPDGSHLSIAIFLQKSKEEKEVAKIAEQCLMRIQADGFLRNMPSDLQMP